MDLSFLWVPLTIIFYLVSFRYPEIGLVFYIFAFDATGPIFDYLNIPLGWRSLTFALPIVFLLVLYAIIKGKTPRIYFNTIFIVAIAFGLFLFAGVLWTPSPQYGIWKTEAYLLFNLVGMMGIILFSGEFSSQRRIILSAAILGIVTCVLSIHDIFTYNLEWKRFSGYSNPIWLSRSVGAYVFAILVVILTTKYRSLKLCLFVVMGGLFYIMFHTGSRGPVFSFFITLAFIPFLLPGKSLIRKMAIFLVFTILGIFLFVKIPSEAQERYLILLRPGGYIEDTSAPARLYLYGTAFNLFLAKPILGSGTGGFSLFSYGLDGRIYPHNIFLEIGSELGMVGLALFILFLLLNVAKIKKLIIPLSGIDKSNIFLIWATLLFIFSCVNAMVSGDIASNSTLWFSSSALLTYENSVRKISR